ncbi:sulfotransferase family 2 domain-containing protein [Mesobacterium pallidum]|uniref:sulfotransferase family 2 domain-containing protein n=1 Tax=Mesobacterium pallidum TaxID=2872037 RepID=UPI001EE1805E|nr:sulfotransferase family 2 domain-containing protein [Mesobacterium pallidum]
MADRLLRYARQSLKPLGQNAAHGFAARHALCVYPSGAVYSFIPKNACSTMRVSLAMANRCIDSLEDWTWIHNNNQTFCASLRELVTAPFTFTILRCPHARLASVFLDKLVGRRPEFWMLHGVTRDGIDPDMFTFREFVGLLEKKGILKFDLHWRPQVDFLVYEDYDLWVPLEQFGGSIKDIEAGAGMTIQDARKLTNHGTDGLSPVEGDFSDTPLYQLAEMRRAGQVPTHASLYDTTLADQVGRIYDRDGQLYRELFGPSDLLFPETFKTSDDIT